VNRSPAAEGLADAVYLAVEAMATRFELVLPLAPPAECDQQPRLRTIGEEALAEIVRLESRLSCYRSTSEITWINAHAGRRSVKVEPVLFGLLRRCLALSDATDGAFDVTVGPLMRAWNFVGASGALPSPEALADARARVGHQFVALNGRTRTIRFRRPRMSIDLGSAGKGYAIDAAIQILRHHGVTSALLHGGTSSVHALGAPPGADAWLVGWSSPAGRSHTFSLRDGALSVSAVHGKAFVSDGEVYGHVIDPRSGAPTRSAAAAAVTGPSSFECDALSTALLVLGPQWLPALRTRFPGYQGDAA